MEEKKNKSIALLITGKLVKPKALESFLAGLKEIAGPMSIAIEDYEKIAERKLASSLNQSSVCFQKIQKSEESSSAANNNHSGKVARLLSFALKTFPESEELIVLNASQESYPSFSKASKILNSNMDYDRDSNCIFLSRKYAVHVAKTEGNPSYELARKDGFKTLSLVSNFVRSPRTAIHENTILKFALVGASGTVINYIVVAIFKTWIPWFNLVYGDAVGIEFSIINNFIWNDRYTFPTAFQKDIDHGKAFQAAGFRFVKYNLVSLLSTFVNLAVFYYLNTILGVYWIWSLLLAIIAAFVINYFGSSRWAWSNSFRMHTAELKV